MFIDPDYSVDQAAMLYESPINIIQGQLKIELEGKVMKAVQNVGVEVDKEELIRALQYDRDQYDKGFRDGVNSAVKHGRWCFMGMWEECSVCKHPISVDGERTNFCPDCGAKMDGKDDK